MSLLTPTFLLLGLLAGPIILLYMLRLRRREVQVSSTMLWQRLLRDREANAPWQRLRRNLLLLLQLLILALLVFALARPFLPIDSVVTGNVVVLLDASASMQTVEGESTRFEMAQAIIDEAIGDLGGDDQMTLIRVGRTAEVVRAATADEADLKAALAELEPTNGEVDWPAAVALASGAAQGFEDARIVVVSDGGLPQDLPTVPGELVYLPVGEATENLAVSAVATQQTDGGIELFTAVANWGFTDQEALLSVDVNGVLFDSRRINVGAGARENYTWAVPDDTATVTARLSEQSADFLPLDDTASAVHAGGITNRTLLVTNGNTFLEQILAVLPGIEAFRAVPDNLPTDTFDLYVYDGVPLPDPLPAGDLLVVDPRGSNELFTVTGTFSNTVTTRVSDSPLLQFVEWSDIAIREASAVEAPWGENLVTAAGGPLLLNGEVAGNRIAIITFDLRNSDLPLQIAYPILMANMTSWLTPGQIIDGPTQIPPGIPVTLLPPAATQTVVITSPSGDAVERDLVNGSLIYAETTELGLYTVQSRDSLGLNEAGAWAVNMVSEQESTIQPTDSLQIGVSLASGEASESVGQRELWPWLAAIAFIVLLVEWWIHHRGTTAPKLPQRISSS